MSISLLRIVSYFFLDSFIFGEATSSYLYRLTTSSQQLLFRSSYFFSATAFFEELHFRKSLFLETVFYSTYFFGATLFEKN